MKRRWFIIALVLLTVVNIAAFSRLAYRQYCSHGDVKSCARNQVEVENILTHRLNLREDQIKSMRTLRFQFNQGAEQCVSAMEVERMALTNLLMEANLDSIALKNTTARIDSLQADLQRQVIKHLLAQKNILDIEQQKLFFSMVLHSCAMNSNQCITHNSCNNKKE